MNRKTEGKKHLVKKKEKYYTSAICDYKSKGVAKSIINSYTIFYSNKEERNMQVTKDMLMGDLLRKDINVAYILMGSGMHCVGCPSSQMESLEEAAAVHGIDCDKLVAAINEFFANKEASANA